MAPSSTKNAPNKQSSLKIAPLIGKPSIYSAGNANKAQQLKQQLLDERELQRKKRMITREKYERDNCG
jgi:hypothetical protein